MNTIPSRIKPFTLALGLTLPVVVGALEYRADLSVGAEHTDNVFLDGSDEQSDLETTAMLRLGLSHEGPSLNTEMDYRYEKQWFDEASELDESTLQGDTSLSWQILSNRLFLEIDHSRRNALRDSADLDVSANREDRDILTVSSYYVFQLGGVDTLTPRVAWTTVNYEDTEASDSERSTAGLTWTHQLSKVDSFSVDASSTDVDVDSDLGDSGDYRYDRITVGYQAELSRLNYVVRVGANRADREAGQDDVDGVLFELDANYVSGFQNWGLLVSHSISDSSLGNDNEVLEDLDRRDEFDGEVDVLEESVIQMDWSSSGICERCTLRLSLVAEDNAYEVRTEDDGTELGGLVGFDYRLTRQGTIRLRVTHRALDYDDDLQRDDYTENLARLGYEHRLGQRLTLAAFVSQRERNSDNDGPDYDEFRGGVSVSYQFLP